MESELKNLIRLWVFTFVSLSYCYYVAAKIPKGLPRLLALFPVMILLFIIPFNIYSIYLGPPLVFSLSWFTNFNLIAFAFNNGPLSPPPAEGPHVFILKAVSSFKIKQASREIPSHSHSKVTSLILEAVNKVGAFLVISFCSYIYKQHFQNHVLLILYFFHTYLGIQVFMTMAAIPAQTVLGVEVEPQFNSPLLATSLQDFWGRRWNLRVSDMLRLIIYNPVRSISTRIIGARWASLPAVLATFVTSGLMHELIYYHMIRQNPTWEVTWFFVLQGVFVDIEIILKKKHKFRLHRAISGPLALAILAVTAGWLSYPLLLRNGIDEKIIKEFNVFLELFFFSIKQ